MADLPAENGVPGGAQARTRVDVELVGQPPNAGPRRSAPGRVKRAAAGWGF
jgi:hypothetical protein